MNTIEQNILLAEFLCVPSTSHNEYDMENIIPTINNSEQKHVFFSEDLRFHYDWNWLTVVINKLIDHDDYSFADIAVLINFNSVDDTYWNLSNFIKTVPAPTTILTEALNILESFSESEELNKIILDTITKNENKFLQADAFHSGGGCTHAFFLLKNKKVLSFHVAESTIEISHCVWTNLDCYYSESAENIQMGFGWEYVQSNYVDRSFTVGETIDDNNKAGIDETIDFINNNILNK